MTTLQQLLTQRAELLEELNLLNQAIEAFADASPVEIRTHRKIKNTPYVVVGTYNSGGCLVIFSDQELTTFASEHSSHGYVSKAAWTQFQLDHSDLVGHLVWSI